MSRFPDETQNITMRPALPSDEPLLFKLFASTRMEELALVLWNEAQLEAFLNMQLNAQKRTYLMQYPAMDQQIILSSEQEIGRLMLNRTEGEILLVDITLLPEFRRRGIGGFILKALQSEAARDAKNIRLHVFHSNPARRLYERAGFAEVGESSMYFEMLWRPEG